MIVVQNEDGQVYGGYTPCPWTCNRKSSFAVEYGKDETLTTCTFILRTKFEHGPQLFKLKKNKMHTAVAYRGNTAFDFGCNDFYLYDETVNTWAQNCCFENNDDVWAEENDFVGGAQCMNDAHEIEIYQLY